MLILFCAAGAATAGDGAGVAIKIGAQALESPVTFETEHRTRLALEITGGVVNNFFDMAIEFGGSSLGTFIDDEITVDENTVIEDLYSSDLNLFDIRIAARFYPLGYDNPLRPYLGGGIGYYWFYGDWVNTIRITVEDPPGVFTSATDVFSGNETVTDAFFPFVTAGLAVKLSHNCEAMFEFQYDFGKDDDGFDLGGPMYMLGLRLRF